MRDRSPAEPADDPSMIDELLPAAAASAEVLHQELRASLFPEEQRAIRSAIEKRRREFTSGRGCARLAMARLGFPAAPVVPGPKGEPIWPHGLVGSITHCRGYRAAVIARDVDVRSVGIDAEPNEPLPEDVIDDVTNRAERGSIAELTRSHPSISWDRLIFCAKEASYKAWFPITGRWLEFSDVVVTIEPQQKRWAATVAVHGGRDVCAPPTWLEGHFLVRAGLILVAVTVRPVEQDRTMPRPMPHQ